MRKIALFIVICLLSACSQKANQKEILIFARIEYIYKLKSFVSHDIWKDFDNKKFDLPLVYFTKNASYVANPTLEFLKLYKSNLLLENPEKDWIIKNETEQLSFYDALF